MAFYIEKAIFVNRAPFEHLELNFKEKGINVLAAINGRGKTTVLSHITDAFYELAKLHYSGEFTGKENKFYRISSSLNNIDLTKPSYVYFRFRNDDKHIDYIDIRNNCTIEEYDTAINLNNKIPFNIISQRLQKQSITKYWHIIDNKDTLIPSIFDNHILTYFPAYRHEKPSYLNDPYQFKIEYKIDSDFSGYLKNPIEVVTGMRHLTNWIMEVLLDWEIYKDIRNVKLTDGTIQTVDRSPESAIWRNLNNVLSMTLASKIKSERVRLGIGKRNQSGTRISIVSDQNGEITTISPNINCLSSGEIAMLCCFGELLRQADNILTNTSLDNIYGIVLIDEIDKHLHIKLQKECLPKLFSLFPNIQFIISSHSPFLNMGLADEALERTQIFDLDNNGIVCSPKNNALYTEVYDLMVNENERYAEKYRKIISKINTADKPIIITEGKTDYKHIQNAIHALGITDMDVDFYDVPDDWGDSKLRTMLENISRIKQHRIVIGIFDRDDPQYIEYVTGNNQYRSFGDSNVYAFAIPLVNEDIYGDQISIEHYYKKENLLKSDTKGRRLFLGKEFYDSGNSINGEYQTKISKIQHKVKINGIIDDKVYESNDLKQSKNIALSKSAFVELIISDSEYNKDFDFSSFNQIINIIKSIISNPIK